MRDISHVLKTLGLLDSETKTYLAALELGPSTVIQLTGKTGISRQGSYTAIEALIGRGLMSSVEKGKKTLYAAESPERLVSFAEARLRTMESTIKEIKAAADDLHLMRKGEKPVVKMFEGTEGFIALREDILESAPTHIEEIANDDSISQLTIDKDISPLKEKLEKMGAKSRVIVISKDNVKSDRRNKEVRQIRRKDINYTGDVIIYGNKIALSSLKGKLIGVIIESEELAQTMRSLFQLAWDRAGE